MHRLVVRVRLLSPDNLLLMDKQLQAEHRFDRKSRDDLARSMLQSVCASNCAMDAVYDNDWQEFRHTMQMQAINWQDTSTRARIDDDLFLQVTKKQAANEHLMRAGTLAIQHKEQTLATQIPAVTVQYRTNAGNHLILSCWGCDCRQHGKVQTGRLCAAQTWLTKGTQCIVNPHTKLRKHVPSTTLLQLDENVSHYDLRQKAVQSHNALLNTLHAVTKDAVQISVTPNTVRCLTEENEFQLLSVYFKM